MDEMWEILGLCWSQQPSGRPNAKHVLTRLDGKSSLWPPSEVGDDEDTDTDDEQSAASVERKPGTGGGLGTKSGHGAFLLPHLKFSVDPSPVVSSSEGSATPRRKHTSKGGGVGDILKQFLRR